jgi:hypothetical protein
MLMIPNLECHLKWLNQCAIEEVIKILSQQLPSEIVFKLGAIKRYTAGSPNAVSPNALFLKCPK